MQRYVSLNENRTIKLIGENQFEGSQLAFVDPEKESTLINTPYLCWLDEKGVLHIPEDAPLPTYEQKIKEFKETIARLQNSDTQHTQQLEEAKTNLSKYEDMLDKSDQEKNGLMNALQGTQQMNMQLTMQIDEYKGRLEEVEKKLEGEKKSKQEQPQNNEKTQDQPQNNEKTQDQPQNNENKVNTSEDQPQNK